MIISRAKLLYTLYYYIRASIYKYKRSRRFASFFSANSSSSSVYVTLGVNVSVRKIHRSCCCRTWDNNCPVLSMATFCRVSP